MEKAAENAVTEYITTALLQLMKKKPFPQISVKELCEKAGVSRMSFYRHFGTKEDVLRRECTRITDAFIARSGISYRNDPLKDYFITLFTHLYEYRELAMLLNRAGLLSIVRADLERVFLTVYKDIYEEYKCYFISGGIYDVACRWLRNGSRETPEELAEKLNDILEK